MDLRRAPKVGLGVLRTGEQKPQAVMWGLVHSSYDESVTYIHDSGRGTKGNGMDRAERRMLRSAAPRRRGSQCRSCTLVSLPV